MWQVWRHGRAEADGVPAGTPRSIKLTYKGTQKGAKLGSGV
jgi:hypothetical protein